MVNIEQFDSWTIGIVNYEFIDGICTYLKSTFDLSRHGRQTKRDYYIDVTNSNIVCYLWKGRILR